MYFYTLKKKKKSLCFQQELLWLIYKAGSSCKESLQISHVQGISVDPALF